MSATPSASEILERIEGVIAERARERPAGSYVTRLLDSGPAAIGAKLREEAGELDEAGQGDDRAHTVHEAADLIFHTLVLLGARDIGLAEVCGELQSRFGVGGLAEKASREAKRADQ